MKVTMLFHLPPKIDLSYSGLEKFQQPEFESYGPKSCKIEFKNASENIPNELKESTKVKKSFDVPLVKKLVSYDKLEKKIVVPNAAKIEFVKAKQQEKPVRKPIKYDEMYRGKDGITLQELMVLCTTSSKKVESLETDLMQTKQIYGDAYTKLIKKVKKLKQTVKSSQASEMTKELLQKIYMQAERLRR
nr:hypothetical protein [Tanacetum cinerariifolium]